MGARDWSPAEDRRPGIALMPRQPELVGGGKQWTLLTTFNWPAPGYTQMTITETHEGAFVFNHGRVYELQLPEDDGA